MQHLKQLRYRTFDELFEDVSSDFRTYSSDNLIEPQDLIKVARKVNKDLGLRIYATRQVTLEVHKGKVKLPDDMYVLNFGFVCGDYEVIEALPQGTHIEEKLISPPKYTPDPGTPSTCDTECKLDPCPDPCNDSCETPDPCTNTCLTKCGEEFQLVQKYKTTTRKYNAVYPLHIEDHESIDCDCPNLSWGQYGNKAKIKHGWLYTNFDEGTIYLNYLGDMIDSEGNLLVLEHELINEYYEYALKKRILENLVMNDEGSSNISNQYQIINQELRAARNNALTVVNTPNFKELRDLKKMNRKVQYHKYYNQFKSNWPYSYKPSY